MLWLGAGFCGGIRGCNEAAVLLAVAGVLSLARAGRLMTRPDALGSAEVRSESLRVADDDLGEAGRVEVEPGHAPDVVGGDRA